MSLLDGLRNILRRRGPDNDQTPPATPAPSPPPFTPPPGTRPVIVKTQTAHISGIQDLDFVKREIRFRDDQNAKYSESVVQPTVLDGCHCVVTSPHEVAYVSDISGLPVCAKCARVCICGHKVGPLERVMVEPGKFMCTACHDELRRKARWAAIGRFLLGSFVSQEQHQGPQISRPEASPVGDPPDHRRDGSRHV